MNTDWTIGQTVILREPTYRSEPREVEATITRIGRKYVYVNTPGSWAERGFHKDDGREQGDGNYRGRIFTEESLKEHKRREAVMGELREATRDYLWHNRLSTDAAEQILSILKADR